MPFSVGEVREPDDNDFRALRIETMELGPEWKEAYNKKGITVWAKPPNGTTEASVKMQCVTDVPANLIFQAMMDPSYQPKWDNNLLETKDIYSVGSNATIGYYAAKCPAPIKNRDFCMFRFWRDSEDFKISACHSCVHKEVPVKKGFIRAVCYRSCYLIMPNFPTGSIIYYHAQTDSKAILPKWLINKVTTWYAPKTLKKLVKEAQKYPDWSKKTTKMRPPSPPPLVLSDIASVSELLDSKPIDESNATAVTDDKEQEDED